LDADGNASVNILKRYMFRRELPLSFRMPIDGSLNLWGRLASTSRIPGAATPLAGKPTTLVVGS